MSNCRPYIPDYQGVECSNELGRVVGLAFIHKDIHSTIYANPSNAALWVDANYSLDLHVFQEVRGTYTSEETESPGFGGQATRIVNATHTLECRIEGVRDNEDFWNQIALSHQYRVAFVTGGDYGLLRINNKDVSIYAKAPTEEGLDSELVWMARITWQDFNNPKSSAVPSGIFQ